MFSSFSARWRVSGLPHRLGSELGGGLNNEIREKIEISGERENSRLYYLVVGMFIGLYYHYNNNENVSRTELLEFLVTGNEVGAENFMEGSSAKNTVGNLGRLYERDKNKREEKLET